MFKFLYGWFRSLYSRWSLHGGDLIDSSMRYRRWRRRQEVLLCYWNYVRWVEGAVSRGERYCVVDSWYWSRAFKYRGIPSRYGSYSPEDVAVRLLVRRYPQCRRSYDLYEGGRCVSGVTDLLSAVGADGAKWDTVHVVIRW